MISSTTVKGAISDAVESGAPVELDRYEGTTSVVNELCLFLKPEITSLPASNFDKILNLLLTALDEYGLEIAGAFVIPGACLASHSVMRSHYGVIDKVSREGASALNVDALENLYAQAPEKGRDAELLGGHQFLESHPSFTGEALTVLYENSTSYRAAGGVHCGWIKYRGRLTGILNGFHPDQVDRYEDSESAILMLVLRGQTDWASLRRNMVGATNPAVAEPGSLRRTIFDNAEALGLHYFNPSLNGVHLSAGPVEGMAEIVRFVALTRSKFAAEDTSFGKLLLKAGSNVDQLHALVSDAIIDTVDGPVNIYDITEEKDAAEALNDVIKIEN
ncbi:hypothetical protein [Arthrobacter sp. D5-1]|uniref:hypothetical protein n=1 Tax=Arthrobacter sp. D5-1 TaxID=1477518 RepID=UPI001A99F54D|nr:hypothetical protein [Arthrobacter sp. D5-1]QSZ50095.1 hypothetical protein AYX22_17900 [Arthrobacter sp. D5-1]